MEQVRFNIGMNAGVDAQEVKRTLEELAKGLSVSDLSLKVDSIGRHTYIFGRTSQASYESLFGAKLRYDSRTINAAVGRPQNAEDWVEDVPSNIGNPLRGIHLL